MQFLQMKLLELEHHTPNIHGSLLILHQEIAISQPEFLYTIKVGKCFNSHLNYVSVYDAKRWIIAF